MSKVDWVHYVWCSLWAGVIVIAPDLSFFRRFVVIFGLMQLSSSDWLRTK